MIGLLNVDPARFDDPGKTRGLFEGQKASQYRDLLTEKNRLISTYRDASTYMANLTALRANIDAHKAEAYAALDDILLQDFQFLKIKYEQAQPNGKTVKRPVALGDIQALAPFHWGYEFDEIIGTRGGFDVIITNPPWEIFKPQAKEFFAAYSDLVTKNKMDIKQFEQEQERLLANPEVNQAWLEFQSRYPFVSAYYRSAPQFVNQISVVNGKKAGTDINLYKLFVEQSYNLLRVGGLCGIVIPSGIYTDLGTKQLRETLFSASQIQVLFGLSNEKYIFEGVHHAFKLALLVFAKGKQTESFEAAFRINPREAITPQQLESFLHTDNDHLRVYVPFIRRTSPDSLSVTEYKSEIDVHISEKMLRFPLLGEEITGKWSIKLTREFDMTNDSHLFRTSAAPGRLPSTKARWFISLRINGKAQMRAIGSVSKKDANPFSAHTARTRDRSWIIRPIGWASEMLPQVQMNGL